MGKPETNFRNGLVKATVWQNVSGQGEVFRSVSLTKSYKREGKWLNTSSLGMEDVVRAIDVLKQAVEYMESTPLGEAAEEAA